MTIEEPDRERGICAHDIFAPLWLRREYPGDIVLAPGNIEHGSIAKNEPECEKRLRTGAIVIVSIARTLNAAGCAIAGAPEGGALKRHVL